MEKPIEKKQLGAKEKDRVVAEFAKFLRAEKQQKIQQAMKLLRKPKGNK